MRMKTLIVWIAVMVTAGLYCFEALRADATLQNNGEKLLTTRHVQRSTPEFGDRIVENPIRQHGACTNAEDLAIIYGGGMDTVVLDCTVSCFGSPDLDQCVSDCLVTQTGLSQGCADCFGALSGCTVSNCFSECSINPSSPECLACLEAAGCTSDFGTCSGLGPIFADGFESGDTAGRD